MAADLMSLDAFLGKKELAKGAAGVIVISSTYNGTPPDNAAQFMRTSLSLSLSRSLCVCLPPMLSFLLRVILPHALLLLSLFFFVDAHAGFLEDGAAVESAFKGVPVSVFGCGNTQWARTYQVSFD